MSTPQAAPGATFKEWRQAVDAAARVRRSMVGRRVRHAGILGDGDSAGKITDVTASGIKVRFDYGTVEVTHPDDLVFLP